MDYKFYIDYGSGEVEIHPVDQSQLVLVDEVVSGEVFKRRVLTGDLVLQNDQTNSYTDYQTIRSLYEYQEITLIIRGDYDSYASILWQGYFSNYNGEYDDDVWQMIATDIEPDDYYRRVMVFGSKDYNLFDFDDMSVEQPIVTKTVPEKEEMVYGSNVDGLPPSYYGGEIESIVWEKFGVGWLYAGMNDYNQWIWRRYKLNWQPATNWDDGKDGFYYYGTDIDNYTFDVYQPNMKSFKAIIKAIYDDMQGSVSGDIVSSFLNDSINPISLLKNKYRWLAIGDKADFKPLISDWTTVTNVNFNSLMDILKESMQVYWKINDSGNLVIEHIDYFDNGDTYSGSPTVGIDMTTSDLEKYIEDTSKYSYNLADMPNLEKWTGESKGEDFVGLPIEYPLITANSVRRKVVISHTIGAETDIPNLREQGDDLSGDGLVLASTDILKRKFIQTDFDAVKLNPFALSSMTYGRIAASHSVIGDSGGSSDGLKGVSLGLLSLKRGERFWIEYSCTLGSVFAKTPKMAFFMGDEDGAAIRISDEIKLSESGGLIGINVWATSQVFAKGISNGYIYIYNDDGDICNFDISFTISRVYSEVWSGIGKLSGDNIINEPLSLATLHNLFWKHYRPMVTGTMNGVEDTVFISKRKSKKQISFFFPKCWKYFFDIGIETKFNVYEHVRTQMGVGEIIKAEFALDTGTLDLELLYDDSSRLKTALGIGGIGVMEVENDNIVG